LTGTIGACVLSCGAGTPNLQGTTGLLEQFTEGSVAATGNGTTPLSFTYGAATSFTDILMDDIGFASNSLTTIKSGGVSGPDGTVVAGTGGTVYQFSPNSETLQLQVVGTAAPEPVSILLMVSGLLGVAWVARKRSVRA